MTPNRRRRAGALALSAAACLAAAAAVGLTPRAGAAQAPAGAAKTSPAPPTSAPAAGAPARSALALPATAPLALARAFDLETSRPREAVAAFRRALALADTARDADSRDAALLGLERLWSDEGHPDSSLALAADVLRQHPADPVAHSIALRTLAMMGRDAQARASYDLWRRSSPADAGPYLEYLRLLLDATRRAAADSVLADADHAPLSREARSALRPSRARALVADGAWVDAARTWRDVLTDDAVYADAAVYALRPAPDTVRDAVVGALAATGIAQSNAAATGSSPAGAPSTPPIERDAAARRAAAALLVAWHRPSAAWALATALPLSTESRDLWRIVAAELDASGARRTAADAWARVLDASPRGSGDAHEAFTRAADDALQGGDPARALALLDRERAGAESRDSTAAPLRLLRVQALAALGRVDEAERVAAEMPIPARSAAAGAAGSAPGSAVANAAADALAAAWIARGDVPRAAAALRRVGADSGEAAGWLALATGNLRGARANFAHSPPALDPRGGLLADVRAAARAVLARTRADSAPGLGDALLAAARGDAPGSVAALERAARALPDVRAPLMAAAADVASGAGDRARAAALWRQILADAADAPEAPAAELAWARSLLAAGDRTAARSHFEHLIMGYPDSALVPIARRELDRLGSA